MQLHSSSYFIPREGNDLSNLFKHVRLMPLYYFPHIKDMNFKIVSHQKRFFVHIDFDAFFAQVEQRDNLKLRGKPVSVGGNSKRDDFSDSAYYVTRGALAQAVTEANKYLLHKGMVRESAPALVSFISKVASRFGIIISEGAAAKSVPVMGAASGGAINLVFMNHFQRMAEGHFTVKQLENKYGKDEVMGIYKSL